jgi:formate dehydrogenase subunit delta
MLMRNEQLVTMANEIAAFFTSTASTAEAAAGVGAHLRRYWDPRMRRQIAEHVAAGGEGLHPVAREGVSLLAQQNEQAPHQ